MTKLDEILQSLEASNHDLVEMLPANLNHKMVQKARLGKKPVPKHTQDLILQAVNAVFDHVKEHRVSALFRKRLVKGIAPFGAGVALDFDTGIRVFQYSITAPGCFRTGYRRYPALRSAFRYGGSFRGLQR